jgi:purine-cytosine permease-like protein
MTQILQQLIDAVKQTAPVIWEAYYRQIYVGAFGFFLAALVVAVLGIMIVSAINKTKGKSNEDDVSGAGKFIGWFIFAIVVLLTGCALARLYNPNYYAIKLILSSLQGG